MSPYCAGNPGRLKGGWRIACTMLMIVFKTVSAALHQALMRSGVRLTAAQEWVAWLVVVTGVSSLPVAE